MHVTGAERTVTVSQEAMRYAALYADPNLDNFEDGVPTSTEGMNPSVTNNLYRYVDFGIGDYGEADISIKNDLISRITDTAEFMRNVDMAS